MYTYVHIINYRFRYKCKYQYRQKYRPYRYRYLHGLTNVSNKQAKSVATPVIHACFTVRVNACADILTAKPRITGTLVEEIVVFNQTKPFSTVFNLLVENNNSVFNLLTKTIFFAFSVFSSRYFRQSKLKCVFK